LIGFEQFLRERTYIHTVTPGLIGKADLQHFVVHLRQRGVRPVTCNTWIRALNAFCRWLHGQGEATASVKLAPRRLEKRIIRTTTKRRSARSSVHVRRRVHTGAFTHWSRRSWTLDAGSTSGCLHAFATSISTTSC
jgi:hypothetical protein